MNMRTTRAFFLTMLILPIAGIATMNAKQDKDMHNQRGTRNSEEWLKKEVRHELLSVPWYSVFDNLAYSINGNEVTLSGQVVNPTVKTDAENAVKHIEGVEKVNNQIEVLPPSPMDDQIRLQLFQAIYGYAPLQKYALGVQKPIRIIVKSGRVTLEGVVDNETDKNLAGMRANGVPGIFSVTNNLQVVPNK